MDTPQYADTSGIFHHGPLPNFPQVDRDEVIGYIKGNWSRREQFATCPGTMSGLVAENAKVREEDVLCSVAEQVAIASARAPKRKSGKRTKYKVPGREIPVTGRVYPDLTDFRDKFYVPTLVEVASEKPLKEFHERVGKNFPVLDQRSDGACTGFALATVAHYLLRTRAKNKSRAQLSGNMIYDMARRYDEWPGENYSGSSARGSMKAWHKHGICKEALWPNSGNQSRFDVSIAKDSMERPLGAYFRVDHKDLVAMHSAISETGILFTTLETHQGWGTVKKDGRIRVADGKFEPGGGHAVAIVGYDRDGFWLQNSWGTDWGHRGYAHITYNDWLENGWDVWVARLGAPVDLAPSSLLSTEYSATRAAQTSQAIEILRPHIVSVGNNGELASRGTFANSEADIDKLFSVSCKNTIAKWSKRRILLYAHGGLVNEDTAVQRVADYKEILLRNGIYPLSIIWHSGFWETITGILNDSLGKRKSESFLGEKYNHLLDRIDGMLEALASAPGTRLWSEMKENALLATTDRELGAMHAVVRGLTALISDFPDIEIHFVGHSAGSIFLAPLVQLWCTNGTITAGPLNGVQGLNKKAASLTHWAPAITHDLFNETLLPSILSGKKLEAYQLYLLDDKTEQDDHCANIYHKSLLYLVSNALEEVRATPAGIGGTPLVGMEKWLDHGGLRRKLKNAGAEIILSPQHGANSPTTAKHHGDFDDDEACTGSTLARLLGKKGHVDIGRHFGRSGSSLNDQVTAISQRVKQRT